MMTLELYPVLRFFQPQAPGRPMLLLWPTFAWQVVAPRPTRGRLDLFERSVLGMCRAQLRSHAAIAKSLMISEDLAKLLLVNLQTRGFLDGAGVLTSSGEKALEEEEEQPPEDLVVGTVYSDPFDGRLWSWFHMGELPLVETERNEKGYPVLLLGTAGMQRRERPYVVSLPDRGVEKKPSPKQILKAIRGHRRERQGSEEEGLDAPWVRRISLVRDQPTLFHLLLRLRAEDGRWVADDPFGWGPSARATQAVEEELDRSEKLRDRIKQLLGTDEVGVDYSRLQAAAEQDVDQRMPGLASAELRDRLVEMYRAYLEATQPSAPADKWDDVAMKAQKVLERLLKLQMRSSAESLHSLSQDEEFNENLLNRIAEDCGFRTPLRENLARVKRGKVIYALESGKASLRPLLLAALLLARGQPEHPLRKAGIQAPDLLDRLDRVAQLRDPASHDGDRPVEPRQGKEVVEDVFVMVKLLSGMGK